MRLLRCVAVLVVLFLFPLSLIQAQNLPTSPGSFPAGVEPSQEEQEMRHRMEKARARQRYEQVQKDSARLVELANELKQYVDKTGENVLSIEVLRKAEEMEKLAHRVKENMRGQ